MKSDYDRLAAGFAKHRWINPRVLDSLLREIASSAARVLEVGAGTGNHIFALAERTGCEGHGVEPSREMRRRAQARGGEVASSRSRKERRNISNTRPTASILSFRSMSSTTYRTAQASTPRPGAS